MNWNNKIKVLKNKERKVHCLDENLHDACVHICQITRQWQSASEMAFESFIDIGSLLIIYYLRKLAKSIQMSEQTFKISYSNAIN